VKSATTKREAITKEKGEKAKIQDPKIRVTLRRGFALLLDLLRSSLHRGNTVCEAKPQGRRS